MKIFLDTANTEDIKSAYDTGLIDGVTTNPTLILKSGRQLDEVARELCYLFTNLESVSTEVVGDTCEKMLTEARKYHTIDPKITIKVPCTVEGLKACKTLNDMGIQTNVTLVFSLSQAILASKAGATFVSPFVGRWLDNSVDGVDLIKNISSYFKRNNVSTKLLAASIRDVRQVELCARQGADVITIPPSVFWKMYNNILTDQGLEQFKKDWDNVIHATDFCD